MRKNVGLAMGSIPILVLVYIWAFGGEEPPKEERKRLPLAHPDATTRDYHAADTEERRVYCSMFVEYWFDREDDLARTELQNYLDNTTGLPASSEHVTMRRAARGYPLSHAAQAAARALGW